MEKEAVKHHHHPHNTNNTTTTTTNNNNNSSNTTTSSNTSSSHREKQIIGESLSKAPQPTEFVLKWGSRKRLRCMKIQVKDTATTPALRTTARVDRRVIRSDNPGSGVAGGGNYSNNGHFNLRQRAASPAQRILRNSEGGGGGAAMKGGAQNYHHSNGGGGGVRGLASPERGERKSSSGAYLNHDNHVISNRTTATSPEKGGSSSAGAGGDPVVWPPKFVIALTNKEKEEDYMAIKGSKLPQRPRKRAKFIQRTLNLVSPGGWLCDLTLERYEVREKKTTKKRPRGLKAMGNYVDSDSD